MPRGLERAQREGMDLHFWTIPAAQVEIVDDIPVTSVVRTLADVCRLLTREQAVCLVDSALNVVDDGFDKSDEDGFKVAQIGHDGRLMSFYENLSVRQASWSLRLAPGGGQLIASDEAGRAVLVLVVEPEGGEGATRVGINTSAPAHELDVNGVVGARGRSGVACPPVRVTICVSNDFSESNPEFCAFLKNYHTSSALTSEALAHIRETGDDYKETAKWFLQNHPELVEDWLTAEQAEKLKAGW